jgi:hypothetical protein
MFHPGVNVTPNKLTFPPDKLSELEIAIALTPNSRPGVKVTPEKPT